VARAPGHHGDSFDEFLLWPLVYSNWSESLPRVDVVVVSSERTGRGSHRRCDAVAAHAVRHVGLSSWMARTKKAISDSLVSTGIDRLVIQPIPISLGRATWPLARSGTSSAVLMA
jgi:hypothetical protein